jgi:protease PrsW
LGQDKDDAMTQTMPEAVPAAAEGPGGDQQAVAGHVPGWPGLWSATVVVTVATGNANLVPASILLGSLLVPVAVVSSACGHADQIVTAQRVVTAVGGGGVLGVLGAGVLEVAVLGRPSGLAAVGVGLLGEAVKLAALWLLARRLPRYSRRDGVVLGRRSGSASPPWSAPAMPSPPCSPRVARRCSAGGCWPWTRSWAC